MTRLSQRTASEAEGECGVAGERAHRAFHGSESRKLRHTKGADGKVDAERLEAAIGATGGAFAVALREVGDRRTELHANHARWWRRGIVTEAAYRLRRYRADAHRQRGQQRARERTQSHMFTSLEQGSIPPLIRSHEVPPVWRVYLSSMHRSIYSHFAAWIAFHFRTSPGS